MEIYEQILGVDHVDTASTVCDWAYLNASQSHYKKAVELYNR